MYNRLFAYNERRIVWKYGEYIRTESGIIEKIKTFDEQTNIFKDEKGKLQKWLGETVFGDPYCEEIVKHSKNIIDLIEVGDYVNGNIVYEVLDDEIELLSGKIRKKRIHFMSGHLIDENEIKTILTYEQYEQNSFKL